MFTFVKSNFNVVKSRCTKDFKPRQRPKPSGFQSNVLREVVRYLKETRCKSRAGVYEHLQNTWGLYVRESRMQKFGGVGTYYWMPNRRCFRVQVGAGHINRKGAIYNYADCVEIYDYQHYSTH